jgi:hypothetical protein
MAFILAFAPCYHFRLLFATLCLLLLPTCASALHLYAAPPSFLFSPVRRYSLDGCQTFCTTPATTAHTWTGSSGWMRSMVNGGDAFHLVSFIDAAYFRLFSSYVCVFCVTISRLTFGFLFVPRLTSHHRTRMRRLSFV